ncbi:MAG TPA: ATP-binding cassette domain-containing protein, partial [Ktedonobacteraceae bacterium]|nr:ATP-binding cassette domain-containing protein [Ktedonobacteraceae bacterium]
VVDTVEPYHGPTKLKGDIAFENVIFGYTKDRPVLKGIELHIPAGRKVALVGYSGSGKTTLVKLIPRFYELEHGSIKIDGTSIADYPLEMLRQNISVVLQDSILFEGSVRENLEIGRPGAPLEEIIDACIKANIHETIANLPDGYDTNVREQGNNFSAGQRQRLAIARAILRDTPILILDEPTANLDVEAESEVMHALNTLIVGRTVLTISHRLSTLGNVDEILVMQQGQIAERGTFRELKRLGGVFASLLEEQNRYNLDREDLNDAIAGSIYAPTMPRMAAISLATSPRMPVLAHVNGASSGSTAMMSVERSNGSHGTVEHHNGNGIGNGAKGAKKTDNLDKVRARIKARIVAQVDGQITGEYTLDKKLYTIGRFPSSDIHIPSQRVSRFHALIRWKDGAWIIQDSESLNGLTCEGQRVDQLALVHGDRILLDPTISLRYEEF